MFIAGETVFTALFCIINVNVNVNINVNVIMQVNSPFSLCENEVDILHSPSLYFTAVRFKLRLNMSGGEYYLPSSLFSSL